MIPNKLGERYLIDVNGIKQQAIFQSKYKNNKIRRMVYVFKTKKVGHVFTITSENVLSINPLPFELTQYTTQCPCHNQPLQFENMGGMRIIRNGKISAKCGISNKSFSVKAR